MTREHVKTPTMKEESSETEHIEITPADKALMESMENHEDEPIESKELEHNSFTEEDEEEKVCQHESEVVFLFLCKYVIPIVHIGPPFVLVNLKFQNLYHVSMRAKNKSARENMKREITQWGNKRVFELMREKKRKKIRKGKRVREKWFVLDVFRLPWLGFEGKSFLKRRSMTRSWSTNKHFEEEGIDATRR